MVPQGSLNYLVADSRIRCTSTYAAIPLLIATKVIPLYRTGLCDHVYAVLCNSSAKWLGYGMECVVLLGAKIGNELIK